MEYVTSILSWVITADIHNSKITSEIELQRNFNIFKDLGPAAKLWFRNLHNHKFIKMVSKF